MARAEVVTDREGRFYGVKFLCPCGVCGGATLAVGWTPPGMERSPHRPSAAGWGFNGDLDLPTFSPSVMNRVGHYADGNTAECYCTWSKRYPDKGDPGFACCLCHSFITNGRITFLSDCTHAYAGQTLDLPEIPA